MMESGEHTYASKNEGVVIMTDNELKLIELIRENDNPEEAILTAVSIITSFLEQPQSFEEPTVACLGGQA
jgi:hypothetical protein